jgi:hypothetical protein
LQRIILNKHIKKTSTHPKPLSSDAYTGWGITNKEVYNQEVANATQRLLKEVKKQKKI